MYSTANIIAKVPRARRTSNMVKYGGKFSGCGVVFLTSIITLMSFGIRRSFAPFEEKRNGELSSPPVSSSLTLYLLVYDCLVQNLIASKKTKVNRKFSPFNIWRERWLNKGYAVLRPARVQTTMNNKHLFQIIRKIVAMWMRLGGQSPAAWTREVFNSKWWLVRTHSHNIKFNGKWRISFETIFLLISFIDHFNIIPTEIDLASLSAAGPLRRKNSPLCSNHSQE